MKKYLITFLAPIVWTIIIFISIGIANGNRFTAVYQPATQIPGYEAKPAFYNVQTSPDLNWEKTDSFGRLLGYIFLAIMWVMSIVVSRDGHLGKRTNDPSREQQAAKSRQALGLAMIGVPLLLSIIFFFANYSSSYANNYKQVDEQTFNQWVQDGKVEKKGEKTYIDATDDEVLKHLFDDHRWTK